MKELYCLLYTAELTSLPHRRLLAVTQGNAFIATENYLLLVIDCH